MLQEIMEGTVLGIVFGVGMGIVMRTIMKDWYCDNEKSSGND